MNVVEWTIENFSFWNVDVHEKPMECLTSGFSYCPRILLYPRVLSGCEEHLVVHVYAVTLSSALSGHLSCIDSSGSVLCTQEISEKEKKGDFYELLPLLKFTEVAAQIRKNKILHKDQFTLRCELRSDVDRAYRMYTTIDVFDSTAKMDFTTPEKLNNSFTLYLQYPQDDCENHVICFYCHGEKAEPKPFLKNISVSSSLSVLSFNSVTRTEENEHVFQDSNTWQILNSLTKEELTEKGSALVLLVKIIPSNKYKHRYGYGYPPRVKALDTVLPTHIFTHHASIVPGNISTKSLNALTLNKPDNSVMVLLTELMCLYKDHEFSDFQLRCGEVSIPTHKSILGARSPVFKAMLLSDMREAASDSVDIADLDINTLGRFLVFLYTGTVDDLEWEVALKLYYAADKYQVPSLKRECFSVFHKNISASNVCDILSLADKHQDEVLTKEAHSFILKNYNDVLKSEGWETFMNNEPMLALKTVTHFAKENTFKVIPDS